VDSLSRPRPDATTTLEIRSLTGLRWWAALWVFAFHSNLHWPLPLPAPVAALVRVGGLGVTVFFILSGFILAQSGLNEAGRLSRSAVSFWRARAARVYPTYALALLVTLPLWLAFVWTRTGSVRQDVAQLTVDIVMNFALLHAWYAPTAFTVHSAGWSLSCEAFFYAIFPALGPFVGSATTRTVRMALLGSWAASAFVGLIFAGYDTTTWAALYTNPLMRLPEFVSGVCLGVLYRRRALPVRATGATAFAALLGLAVFLVFRGGAFSAPLHNYAVVPLVGVIIASTATAERGRPWVRPLTWPLSLYLGRISYAFYLFQVPVFVVALKQPWLPLGGFRALAVTLVATLLLAHLAHAFVERPARSRLMASTPSPARDVAAALP
jgi:peptidoglycan/LPS O-acetylase OafA/YrhL